MSNGKIKFHKSLMHQRTYRFHVAKKKRSFFKTIIFGEYSCMQVFHFFVSWHEIKNQITIVYHSYCRSDTREHNIKVLKLTNINACSLHLLRNTQLIIPLKHFCLCISFFLSVSIYNYILL